MMASVCLDVLWLPALPSVVLGFWLVLWVIIALLSVVVAGVGAYAVWLFQGCEGHVGLQGRVRVGDTVCGIYM
jgi:ABC-type phosphate transport system permease subunit